MDRLADKTPGGEEVKEEFAEEKERQLVLLSLKNNNLFTFLTDEIGLSSEQVMTLVRQSNKVDDLSGHLLALTKNQWKFERLTGVINNFPRVINDFEALKEIYFQEE